MSYAGLATGVRKDGRVYQRCQWALDLFRLTIRPDPQESPQYLRGFERHVAIYADVVSQFVEPT